MNVQPKTPPRRQPPPKPRFQLPRVTLPERLSSGFTLFLLAYGGYPSIQALREAAAAAGN